MTTVALPEMNKFNYNNMLSTGAIACGSTLGVVIPPSVVLVVLADGMTRGSVNDLAECVHAVEVGGATVLGIGIGDDTVRTAYGRHQIVESPETLAAAMVDGVRSSLLKTLAGTAGDGWWLQASRSAAPAAGTL